MDSKRPIYSSDELGHFAPQSLLHFCENGVKLMPEGVVKPLITSLFVGKHWITQGRVHTKLVGEQCAQIHRCYWLAFRKLRPWSTGLLPLEYFGIEYLLELQSHFQVFESRFTESSCIYPAGGGSCFDRQMPDRFKRCVKAKGGHFEYVVGYIYFL